MVDVLIKFLYRSVGMLCMTYLILSRGGGVGGRCFNTILLSLCWYVVSDVPHPV